MLIHSLLDTADGSRCILVFEETNQWLRATWLGYIDPLEALQGAEQYLAHVQDIRCAYLLNDNTTLRGPWFDSAEWLRRAWLPQAEHLGLCYLAHVVQADTKCDILTLTLTTPLVGLLEIQLFDDVGEAEEWLRSCQAQEGLG